MSNNRAGVALKYSKDLNQHGQADAIQALSVALVYSFNHVLTADKATELYSRIICDSVDELNGDNFTWFINTLADINRRGRCSKKVIDLRDYTNGGSI